MHSKKYALIVAGGKGTRIPGNIPKQFLEINGLPVVMHTLNAFFRYSENITVILVLPEDDMAGWNELCRKYGYQKPVLTRAGGNTRFQSVKSGLSIIEGEGLVAIHDGVRPLIDPAIIGKSFDLAGKNSCAIAAVPLKESIRIIGHGTTKALDRKHYTLIQTPQTFQVDLIKEAYNTADDPSLTDDASVAERSGHTVTLFEGSYENIKITTPEDLIVAEALMAARSKVQNGQK